MKKRFLAVLLTVCMVLSMVPTALATGSAFADVNADDWFADEIEYVYVNGLMYGVGGNAFDPSGTVTRAMVWTTLARLDGVDTTGSEPWWLAGQQWAIENEISDGTMAENNITREQLVTMIWRYAKYIDMDVSEGEDTNILSYTDAFDVNEWAIPAMQWACAVGVINGINGALQPQGDASRAMLAAIIYRFVEEVMPEEKEPEPSTPVVPNYPSIPVHFHRWTAGTPVAPTCTEQGYTPYTCTCGASKNDDFVDALDHAWSDWTHNDDDTHTRVCDNDSGHTETADCAYGSWVDNGDGTHTKTCSGCGHEETAACEYDYESEGNGTHIRTCSGCGTEKTESCCITEAAGYKCAHCGYSDVIVVDSISNLLTAITAEDGEGNRTNEGKIILLKKGEYSMSSQIPVHNISITILGEKNEDGTNGVSITQSGNDHIFHVTGANDPNNFEHVIIGGMNLSGGKAGVENRGNLVTDLYDMHITNTSWNAIAIDIGSDKITGIKATVNAHHVTTNGKHAQVNSGPRDNYGVDYRVHFNTAEFNFDEACSDSFKANDGFVNVENGMLAKDSIFINGKPYQPPYLSIDKDGNVEIYNETGLKKFSEFSELHTKLNRKGEVRTVTLMNNITLTGTFTPIGTEASPFKGTFDGNGMTITGLTAGGDAATNVGLFGALSGTVKNLTVDGAEISGTANIGVIAGTVNEGAVITGCTVTDSAVICTDMTEGRTPADCKAGKIAGNTPTEFDLSGNTAGSDVIVMMAYAYDSVTNTYTVASSAALDKAFTNAATVNEVKPTIVMAYGTFDEIVIPNNTQGNETKLAGLTLKGSENSIVGHLNLNCADYITVDGVTFDAGKARSSIQANKYESISSGIDTIRHGCYDTVIQNCTFTGTYQTHPYDCIRFVESIANNNGNNKRAEDITVQTCKFLCNAEQYLRLDYVYGNVQILDNTFGGSGFGTSHNNINATSNHANWIITGNSFNNWQYVFTGSVDQSPAYAFGSSCGADVTFSITSNTFNNASGNVIWLKNYSDETHANGITISGNTYTGGLTKTDVDAIFRVPG